MKKLSVYLILILICNGIIAQDGFIKLNNDDCNPVFKSIYDFQIGDVFQYIEVTWVSSGGLGRIITTTTKYSISDKNIDGDTIIYIINGIKNIEYSCDFGPDLWCETPSKSRFVNDTLVYIDSVNHFLNKCIDEVISGFMLDEELGEVYAKIQINSRGENLEKVVGGEDNLFIKNEKDSLIAYQNGGYQEVYSEHSGKIEKSYWGFEYHSKEYLQGTIKNGDTTGIITSDENLMVTSIINSMDHDFSIYPNPTNGMVFFTHPEVVDNSHIEVHDIAGNKIMTQTISNGVIDLSAFNDGIYFLSITTADRKIIKKVILQ
jgi:hypothetical protein